MSGGSGRQHRYTATAMCNASEKASARLADLASVICDWLNIEHPQKLSFMNSFAALQYRSPISHFGEFMGASFAIQRLET
jgi:hypothetical protein